MNIWSLAIDPASGKALGEPRPETNGVRNLGFARFSADDKRMTCFAYERAQDYLVYRLDPEAQKPELLHELRRQALGAASISPDGRWIVGATTEAREDIVLLRSDGGELRRLTNDAFKDRTALCSPDGKSILFKSTRTGKWQPWTIRFDGSGLAQVGECANCDVHGWDPDGIVAYATDFDARAVTLFAMDMHSVATAANAPKVALDPGISNLTCVGPGPRPRTLFGAEYDASGAPARLGILDVQTGKFERFEIPIGGSLINVPGALLPGGKRAIVLGKDAAYVYDIETKSARKLEGCAHGQGVLLSGDGRTLVIVREVYDGDVWLGESR
jgi:tricorn protease-like protein